MGSLQPGVACAAPLRRIVGIFQNIYLTFPLRKCLSPLSFPLAREPCFP